LYQVDTISLLKNYFILKLYYEIVLMW